MANKTYFLMIVFLAVMICHPGRSDAATGSDDRAKIHISERVRIERPVSPTEQPTEAPGAPADDPAPDAPDVDAPAVEDPLDMAETGDLAFPEEQDALERDMLGEIVPELEPEDRYYSEEGRVDPFAPFLRRTEPETDEEATEEPIRRVPRTPLERIGLGQLKLTAVIMGEPDAQLAMVEDPRGRGYVVRQGTYIGENGGRVSRIESNRIVVEEPHRDVFGQTAIREIELKIQRQAGE